MFTESLDGSGHTETSIENPPAACYTGPIDAVYTWVNGSDPVFIRSMISERAKQSKNDTNIESNLKEIMKRYSYEEICFTKRNQVNSNEYHSNVNFKKDFYYAQSKFIYFECLQEDEGNILQQNLHNKSYFCSIESLEELFQSINTKLLYIDSDSSVDLGSKSKGNVVSKQRFLVYSKEDIDGTTLPTLVGMNLLS